MMRKSRIIIILLSIALLITVISFLLINYENFGGRNYLNRYCSKYGCVYTLYKPNELKDIKIHSNMNVSQLRKFNITFIFINPKLKGNFTTTFLNLVIYMSRTSRVVPTCINFTKGCQYYTNDSLDRDFWLFFNNKTYLINGTKVLRIYIENSTKNMIEINHNFVFLKGSERNIERVLDKFLLYWYGIVNN